MKKFIILLVLATFFSGCSLFNKDVDVKVMKYEGSKVEALMLHPALHMRETIYYFEIILAEHKHLPLISGLGYKTRDINLSNYLRNNVGKVVSIKLPTYYIYRM